MNPSPVHLPNLQTLTQSFNEIFNDNKDLRGPVTILARESNPHTGTFMSEIVTCQLADGSKLRLLCKYATGYNHNAYGHRGGITYEAEVYRYVLQPLPVSTPMFYGVYNDPVTGQGCFIIQYFDNCMRVTDSVDPAVMQTAARWLGQFHQVNAARLSTASLPFLNRHDAEYYLGWAKRTSLLAAHLHQRFPWLATLCQRFEEVLATLLEPPVIIVHGEFYPNNILFCQGTIYPVDWETTAVASGVIDLASLTEGWPAELVSKSIAEYQSARWPEGPPADSERKLDIARLYWHFRWLGERSDWTHQEAALERFEKLGIIGEQLRLI